jgi:hypothetical protein
MRPKGGWVARGDRRRSKQWHFSDSGSRFDAKKRYRPTKDHYPISDTFTRKIVHCRRCGSRVVSNVNHCPFCGKNLQPLYRRFWFWFVIVWLIFSATVALIFYSPQIQLPVEQPERPAPVVVGAPEGTPAKNLPLSRTVNCDNLLVTITEQTQTLVTSDGSPITALKIRFVNEGPNGALLYSTQWQLETATGSRVDCYIGKTDTGESIRSDLDSASLPSGASLTVTLYFAASNPTKLVFAPNALSYSEEELVTWLLNAS